MHVFLPPLDLVLLLVAVLFEKEVLLVEPQELVL